MHHKLQSHACTVASELLILSENLLECNVKQVHTHWFYFLVIVSLQTLYSDSYCVSTGLNLVEIQRQLSAVFLLLLVWWH